MPSTDHIHVHLHATDILDIVRDVRAFLVGQGHFLPHPPSTMSPDYLAGANQGAIAALDILTRRLGGTPPTPQPGDMKLGMSVILGQATDVMTLMTLAHQLGHAQAEHGPLDWRYKLTNDGPGAAQVLKVSATTTAANSANDR